MSYLHLSGDTGNGAGCTAPSMTDDLDVRVRCLFRALAPAATSQLVFVYQSGTDSLFGMQAIIAGLELDVHDNLGAWRQRKVESWPAAVLAADGEKIWFRVVWDQDNGAAGNDVTMYYSLDDTDDDAAVSWTAFAAADTEATARSWGAASTALLTVGSYGSTYVASGDPRNVYRVALYNGIDGTLVYDADFTDLTDTELDAGEFTEDSSNAATVTLSGDEWAYVKLATSIAGKTPELYLDASAHTAGIPKWSDRSGNDHHAQFGSTSGADTNDPTYTPAASPVAALMAYTTDDYFEIVDAAALDFAAGEDFTLYAVATFADATPAADLTVTAKKADITTAAGYAIYLDTTGVPTGVIGDGTASTAATGPALTDATKRVLAFKRDTTADTITVYTDGVAGTPVTDTTTATLANAEALRLGRLSGAGTLYREGDGFKDLLFREAHTDAEVAAVTNELLYGPVTAGTGQLLTLGIL